MLTHELMSSAIRLGKVAQIIASITVGSRSTASIPQEPLPLPIAPIGPEEAWVAQALHGGVQLSDIAVKFPTVVRTAGRRAWLFLWVLAINCMSLRHSAPGRLFATTPHHASTAQAHALYQLEKDVGIFLDAGGQRIPGIVWEAIFTGSKRKYSRVAALKAMPGSWLCVAWVGMEPGLDDHSLPPHIPDHLVPRGVGRHVPCS